jgi:hypothetical protein
VVQSLLKAGLLEEIAADDDQPAWRTTQDGERFALRITDAGLYAIGVEAGEAAHSGPQRPTRGRHGTRPPHGPKPPQDAPVAAPSPARG